jgi:hypothetical protein
MIPGGCNFASAKGSHINMHLSLKGMALSKKQKEFYP